MVVKASVPEDDSALCSSTARLCTSLEEGCSSEVVMKAAQLL